MPLTASLGAKTSSYHTRQTLVSKWRGLVHQVKKKRWCVVCLSVETGSAVRKALSFPCGLIYVQYQVINTHTAGLSSPLSSHRNAGRDLSVLRQDQRLQRRPLVAAGAARASEEEVGEAWKRGSRLLPLERLSFPKIERDRRLCGFQGVHQALDDEDRQRYGCSRARCCLRGKRVGQQPGRLVINKQYIITAAAAGRLEGTKNCAQAQHTKGPKTQTKKGADRAGREREGREWWG